MEGEKTILEQTDGMEGSEINAAADPVEVVAEKPSLFSRLFRLSPDKPIEEYKNHPLNYDRKDSTGRIIRGATGILDDLNYAIFDILFGLLEKFKETKAVKTPVNENVNS